MYLHAQITPRIYMPEEESKLEMLKKLDLRVRMAGTVESLCLSEEIINTQKIQD